MRFDGSGYYRMFEVRAADRPYGRKDGYASLRDAIVSLRAITRGASAPAAGIFDVGGRYIGRPLSVRYAYDDQLGGYTGAWQLEQHPRDRGVFLGDDDLGSGEVTLDPSLRYVIDGKANIDAKKVAQTI